MSENTITRAHLAGCVYKELGLSFLEASELVDEALEQMINAIIKEDQIKIASFGSFYSRSKKKRVGRNPKTKKEAVITPRKVVGFYASNILKNQINSNN